MDARKAPQPAVRQKSVPTAEKLVRGVNRVRILLWAVELVALLAVLEYFLVRPKVGWSELATPNPTAKPQVKVTGRLVPALGDCARPLTGLGEVVPAYLPSLYGLADGSRLAQETQAQFVRASQLPLEVENSVGMRFRLIPPGTFLMGSPPAEAGRWEGETQHVVTLAEPFYMGVCEVTQAQWLALMPKNPSHFKDGRKPVEEVAWYDGQRFAEALCQRENVPLGRYRLPTEREWEYACRAGTQTAYVCGDSAKGLAQFADYDENNNRGTNAVGRRRANAYGLYDLHGNVWEWCIDKFRPYVPEAGAEPGPHADWRMIRGGNWHEPAVNCRSANRARLPPLSTGNMLGFRLVRTIPELQQGVTAPAPAATPPVSDITAPSALQREAVPPTPSVGAETVK
jgi:formylglycine-generating enzyme required for sulfatase activity